jgi:hypothetical protein
VIYFKISETCKYSFVFTGYKGKEEWPHRKRVCPPSTHPPACACFVLTGTKISHLGCACVGPSEKLERKLSSSWNVELQKAHKKWLNTSRTESMQICLHENGK